MNQIPELPNTIAPLSKAEPSAADHHHALLIVFARVHDRAKFGQYVQALAPVYAQFQGQYLAMAPLPSVLFKGHLVKPWSIVLSAWRNLDHLNEFWFSKQYQNVATLRAGTGEFHVTSSILATKPQPGDGILLSTNDNLHLPQCLPQSFQQSWLEGGDVIPSMQIYSAANQSIGAIWPSLSDHGTHFWLEKPR